MKGMKVFLFGFLLLSLISASIVIGLAEETDHEKNIQYEYALLGETYEVEDGLIHATSPQGQEISSDVNTVFLDWAQGSYIFEYPNKIVNLKVYEKAPADEITFSGTVPAEGVAGEKLTFPGMTVKSGIVRTDGAPAIGNYSVSANFWYGGEKVYTERNITGTFPYTPSSGGLWLVSYEYTDVFGYTHNQDFSFKVVDERLIFSSLKSEYNIGDKISSSDFYGFYKGKKYPVSIQVQTPSGNTSNLQGTYIFSEEGTYKLTVSAEMEEEAVYKEFAPEVKSGIASFITGSYGFSDSVKFENYANIKGPGVSRNGLLLDMASSAAGFSYNGVIDLRKLDSQTPIISFTTNNSYGGSISVVEVTLTDVYNSRNTLTVRFSKNSDMTATTMGYDNTLVRVSYGSVSTAFNNHYPTRTDSVSWDTSFYTYWRSPENANPNKTYPAAENLYAMNFSYDIKTNTVYSYGNYRWIDRPDGDYSGIQWWPIADLSASSLPVKFNGFTTGEVYLSLSVVSGRGDIVLNSVGGKGYDVSEDDYTDANALLVGKFDGSVPAVVGMPYSLPSVSSPYINSLTSKVYCNGIEVNISGNEFVPNMAGNYCLVLSGINQFGLTVSKTIDFECVAEKIPVEISYDIGDTVSVGSIYTIEQPSFSGGHGSISYSITANGEDVAVGDKIVIEEETSVSVRAIDELGFVYDKTFEINIDKDVVIFDIDFPKTAFCSEKFTFPEASAYYLLTEQELPYEIYVDGEKQGTDILLSSVSAQLNVEYRTAHGSKFFVLHVKPNEVENGGQALLFNGSASTSDEGTSVTVNAEDPVISLPFMLSPNGLRFEFFVLEENLNFNTMSVRLTNGEGISVKISISKLLADQPTLFINDTDTSVSIAKRRQTFSSGAQADFAGKNYYSFSLYYDDWYKAVLDANKVLSYINADERGIAFKGFGGGVYLDIIPEDLNAANARFVITRIGNQLFYSSAFEYGDVMGPALYSPDFYLGNSNVSPGYVLNLSNMEAFDVLQREATVKISLTDPSGNIIFENVEPSEAPLTALTKIGIYILRISATDDAGASNTVNYRFAVEDETAPAIQINGEFSQSPIKKGDTISLAAATAIDETAVTVKIVAYSPNGNIIFINTGNGNVAATNFTFEYAGEYIIRYIAVDEYENTSSTAFRITVEES